MSDPQSKLSEEAAEANSAAPEPGPVVDADGAGPERADAAAEGGESAAEPADGAGVLADPEEPAMDAAEADTESAGAPSAAEQAARYLALAQRTQADFENYKKRAARDAAIAQQRGIAKLVKELLPALDNLARAISHAPAEDPLLEGIKLVRDDLQGALTRAGIEAFDPAGESFDPNLHEAVAQFPTEGVAAGTVVEVYQAGYRLGETVLRPARVVVAA